MFTRAIPCCFLVMMTLVAGAIWQSSDGDGSSLALRANEPQKKTGIALGAKVPNSSSLRDMRGNRRGLHSFTGNKAIVLAFLGTECPVANLYVPGLIELEKRFRSKKVQFLGIYPNENEDLEQLAMYALDKDLPFPVLKDSSQRLADALGVA